MAKKKKSISIKTKFFPCIWQMEINKKHYGDVLVKTWLKKLKNGNAC